MKEDIKKMIRAIANKNSLQAEKFFNKCISQKIMAKLSEKKKQVSKTLFGEF